MMTRGGLATSLAASARVVAADPVRASHRAVADGATDWTWAELDRRADAVANGLLGAGIEPGDRVALIAAPSAAAVASRVLRLETLVNVPGEAFRGGPVDPAASALAILTSGTTGRPKTAVLSSAALV